MHHIESYYFLPLERLETECPWISYLHDLFVQVLLRNIANYENCIRSTHKPAANAETNKLLPFRPENLKKKSPYPRRVRSPASSFQSPVCSLQFVASMAAFFKDLWSFCGPRALGNPPHRLWCPGVSNQYGCMTWMKHWMSNVILNVLLTSGGPSRPKDQRSLNFVTPGGPPKSTFFRTFFGTRFWPHFYYFLSILSPPWEPKFHHNPQKGRTIRFSEALSCGTPFWHRFFYIFYYFSVFFGIIFPR